MSKVRMYCTADCPYCVAAERFLTAKGVRDIEKLHVDADPALRLEMTSKTQRRTVPQIYIGEVHVGGYTDLAALDREGRLRRLLEGDRGQANTASANRGGTVMNLLKSLFIGTYLMLAAAATAYAGWMLVQGENAIA